MGRALELPPLSPSAWLVCTRKLSAIEDSRTLIAPAHVTVGTVTAANSAVSNASTRSSRVDKGCGASQNAISGRKAHRPQPLVGGCPRPRPQPSEATSRQSEQQDQSTSRCCGQWVRNANVHSARGAPVLLSASARAGNGRSSQAGSAVEE